MRGGARSLMYASEAIHIRPKDRAWSACTATSAAGARERPAHRRARGRDHEEGRRSDAGEERARGRHDNDLGDDAGRQGDPDQVLRHAQIAEVQGETEVVGGVGRSAEERGGEEQQEISGPEESPGARGGCFRRDRRPGREEKRDGEGEPQAGGDRHGDTHRRPRVEAPGRQDHHRGEAHRAPEPELPIADSRAGRHIEGNDVDHRVSSSPSTGASPARRPSSPSTGASTGKDSIFMKRRSRSRRGIPSRSTASMTIRPLTA
jgi:hypothetical protein